MSNFRNWNYRNRKGAKRSPAQEAALNRSFRIFRLRGLWCNLAMLSPERRAAAQALVDADLAELGAEPHGPRMDRQRAE